jgi:hypothetical protein
VAWRATGTRIHIARYVRMVTPAPEQGFQRAQQSWHEARLIRRPPASLASTNFSSQDGSDDTAPVVPRPDVAHLASSSPVSGNGNANEAGELDAIAEANREPGL